MDSSLPRLQLELYKEIKKVGVYFVIVKQWSCFTVLISFVKFYLIFNK